MNVFFGHTSSFEVVLVNVREIRISYVYFVASTVSFNYKAGQKLDRKYFILLFLQWIRGEHLILIIHLVLSHFFLCLSEFVIKYTP